MMKKFNYLFGLVMALLLSFNTDIFGQGCPCTGDNVPPTIKLKPNRKWKIGGTGYPLVENYSIEGQKITIRYCNGSSGNVLIQKGIVTPESDFFSTNDVEVTDNCNGNIQVSLEFINFKIDTIINVSGSYISYSSQGDFCEVNPIPKVKYSAIDQCGNQNSLTFDIVASEGLVFDFYTKLSKALKVDTVKENGIYPLCSLNDTVKLFTIESYYNGCNGKTKKSKSVTPVTGFVINNVPSNICNVYEILWTASIDTENTQLSGVDTCPGGNPDTTRIYVKVGLQQPIIFKPNPNRLWANTTVVQGSSTLYTPICPNRDKLRFKPSDFIATGGCNGTDTLLVKVETNFGCSSAIQGECLYDFTDDLCPNFDPYVEWIATDVCGNEQRKRYYLEINHTPTFEGFNFKIRGKVPLKNGTYYVCEGFIDDLDENSINASQCNGKTVKSKSFTGASSERSTCNPKIVAWEITNTDCGDLVEVKLNLIEDTEAPEIIITNPIKTVSTLPSPIFDTPMVTDNCVTPVVSYTDFITGLGDTIVYLRLWRARDSCQTTLATQTIFLVGGITTICPTNQTITLPMDITQAPVNWNHPNAVSSCNNGTAPISCESITINSFQSLGKFGNSTYYLSNFQKNWSDAQTICAGQNGYLASINTAAENAFLAGAIGNQEAVLIGLNDKDTEGVFRWADGSPQNYTNWETGQPDNSTSLGEDYAVLHGWSKQWNDYNFWTAKRFLLEIPCPGASVGIVQTQGPSSGSVLAVGQYPVTYAITDSCGNVTNCRFTVNVEPSNSSSACVIVNHAYQRPTSQSSTWSGAFSDRAVDSKTSGDFWSDYSVAQTSWETNPWWQVDLGAVRDIQQINIWGRTDCCTQETSGFYVLISDTPFASTADLNSLLSNTAIKRYFVSGAAGQPTVVPMPSKGRYVRLQMAKASFMALAEVQIAGCQGPSLSSGGGNRSLSSGNAVTSVIKTDLTNFGILPNPTAQHVDVILEQYQGKTGDLVIFNQLGVQMYSQHFEQLREKQIHIDLKALGLKNGLYFIGVLNAGRANFKRLVLMDEG
jgi:hypothetical protein